MRGHIRRRGQRWAIIFDAGYTEDGKRKQRWQGGFTTRKVAEGALAEAIGKVNDGTFTEKNKLLVGTFLQRWLEGIRASVRPSTLAGYRMLVDAHITPALGLLRLQSLNAGHLNTFYGHLLEGGRRDGKGGLSTRTVRYCHATLHRALGEAVKWGLVTRNVADAASPPRQSQRREPHVWTAEDLRAFLRFAEGDFFYAPLYLAAMTGMRRGEVLGLTWEGLDLTAQRLSVTRALVPVGGELVVSEPKTARGRRSVALDAATVAVLKAHRKQVLEDRMGLGLGAPAPDALVFTQPNGEPVDPESFSKHFLGLAKAAGLPRIRLHDLRHGWASVALSLGVNPRVVSERLGHSSTAFTLDVYSHVLPGLQEAEAQRVASAVLGG